jgi:hypothetical protein
LSALGLMLSSWEVEVGMNTLPYTFSFDCCGTYLYGNRGFLCFSRIFLFNWSILGEITIVVMSLWKLTLLRVGLVLTGLANQTSPSSIHSLCDIELFCWKSVRLYKRNSFFLGLCYYRDWRS